MTGVTEKLFMCQMFMCLFRPGSRAFCRRFINGAEKIAGQTLSQEMLRRLRCLVVFGTQANHVLGAQKSINFGNLGLHIESWPNQTWPCLLASEHSWNAHCDSVF